MNKGWYWIALAALVAILIAFTVAGLLPAAAADKTTQLENDLRAAALRQRAHREACLAAPGGDVSRCMDRANDEWYRARIIAEARYEGTAAAWRNADEQLRQLDARIKE